MKKLSLIFILSCLSLSLFAASNNNDLHYSGLGTGYSYINYKHNDNNIITVYGPNFAIRGENIKEDATAHYSDLTITIPTIDFFGFRNISYYNSQLLCDYSTGINLLSSYRKGNYRYVGFGAHINSLIGAIDNQIYIDSFVGAYLNAGIKIAFTKRSFIDVSYKASYDFFGFSYDNKSSGGNNFKELENFSCFGQAVNVFFTAEI